MEQSSETVIDQAAELALVLEELGAADVVALDVTGQSSFADAFVIAGAASQAQLRGLQRRLSEELERRDLQPRTRPRRDDESGWLLLDCNSLVIHLMLEEQRRFYELERLWFDATVIRRSGGAQEGEPTSSASDQTDDKMQ